MRRAERLGLWLAVLLIASQTPAVAETPGRIEAAVRAYLVRVGLLDASGAPAASDLAAVLAEGNSAAGPIRLGRGTAAAPAYTLSPDGATGLWNSQSGTEDISFTIDGVPAAHFWRAAAGRVLLNFHGSGEIAGSGSTGLKVTNTGVVWLGNETVMLGRGAGSPEGAVTAPVGSIYLSTDGGASTTFYVKESGTGNTGWVPK